MATVKPYRLKDGGQTWRVEWRDASGRQRTATYPKQAQARAAARTVEAELERQRQGRAGASDTDRALTVSEYGERWLEQVRGSLSPRTVDSYRFAMDRYVGPLLGDVRLVDVTHGDAVRLVEAALAEGAEVNTARLAHAALRRLLSRARLDGIVAENVALGTMREVAATRRGGRRRQQDDIGAMTPQQLDAFFRAAEVWAPEWWGLFQIAYRAGLRPGEALGLCVEDVDLGSRLIRVCRTIHPKKAGRERVGPVKDRETRTVELSEIAVSVLRPIILLRGSGFLWVGRDGKSPRDESRLAKAFRRIRIRAGLLGRFTPKSLRHSYASGLLARGAPLLWVSQQLGHSSPEVTLRHYAWALPTGGPGTSDLLDRPAAGKPLEFHSGDDPVSR